MDELHPNHSKGIAMAQTLFPENVYTDTNTPTIEQAREAGREGMERVDRNATWDKEAVSDFIVDYVGQHGETDCETIVDAAKVAGHVPHIDKAFGPIFAGLSRSGRIIRTGFQARRKGHSAPGASIWKKGGDA